MAGLLDILQKKRPMGLLEPQLLSNAAQQVQQETWNQEDVPQWTAPEAFRGSMPDRAVAGFNEAIKNIAEYSNAVSLNPDQKNQLKVLLFQFRKELEGFGFEGSEFSDLFKRYMNPEQFQYFMERGGSILSPEYEPTYEKTMTREYWKRDRPGANFWEMVSPFLKYW